MKLKNFLWVSLLVLALAGTACAAAPTRTAEPTSVPPILTDTPQPSDTPAPTQTQPPSPTATSTSTATQTPTPSQTPRPSFAGFQVDYGELVGTGMTFRFFIPGVNQVYRVTVNGSEFSCNLNDQTPDRLYCIGKQFNQGQTVKLVFMPPAGDNTSLFETSYKVSLQKTGTPDPRALAAGAPKTCPERGQNVHGEIEWRKFGSGYCVVATCFDACGYYYSLNTCPTGTDQNGIYLFPGPTPSVCK